MERLDTRHRWLDILTGLGVPAKFLRNKHGPCPMCGGKDRFRFDDKDGKGTFFCNGCGAQPMLMVAQARHAVGLASAFVISFCDRIVIHGYLSGLSRPEQVVHFFRQIVGAPVVSKELLSQRTSDYQNWVEAFARNHKVPIQWAEKGVRKEDYVQPWLRRMVEYA